MWFQVSGLVEEFSCGGCIGLIGVGCCLGVLFGKGGCWWLYRWCGDVGNWCCVCPVGVGWVLCVSGASVCLVLVGLLV